MVDGGTRPFATIVQAISLEETVKTAVYNKFIEADSFLQKINQEVRTLGPMKALGAAYSIPEFESAVLAEYRYIRAKLIYVDRITRDPAQKARFLKLKELDKYSDSIPKSSSELQTAFQFFVECHVTIGEFLEADGVTKYERDFPDLGSVMVQRN